MVVLIVFEMLLKRLFWKIKKYIYSETQDFNWCTNWVEIDIFCINLKDLYNKTGKLVCKISGNYNYNIVKIQQQNNWHLSIFNYKEQFISNFIQMLHNK